MSLTGAQVANLVKTNRAKVIDALGIVVPSLKQRNEIVGEIISTGRYLRYNNELRKVSNVLRFKCCIVAVYEAINEPDQAIHEIEQFMYS